MAGSANGAADAIVDDVDALAAGCVFQLIAPVGVRVVDQDVGAAALADGELIGGRGAGDDLGAHDLGEFDGGEARPAGCAKHRNRFACFEVGAILEAIVAGAVCDGDAGGNLVGDTGGRLDQANGGSRDLSRAAPMVP